MAIETESSHDGELVDEAVLAVLGVETGLLGEGLDCELGVVGDPFDLVDGGEVALAQFLEGLEHLMEALPINFFGEAKYPGFDHVEVGGVEAKTFLFVIE